MLPRIFAVAVGVNAVAVLVAAQFGAFKSIQREFGASKVVLLAPADAPKEKEKPVEKTKKEAPKPSTTKKAPGPANKSTSTPKNRLAQPKEPETRRVAETLRPPPPVATWRRERCRPT